MAKPLFIYSDNHMNCRTTHYLFVIILQIKMATLPSFILLFILVSVLAHTRTTAELICKSTSCESGGGPLIRFPFRLKQTSQSYLCSYPGFELSCTNSTTFSEPLLTLPESGDFVVKRISLEDQRVWVNDPNECLPERFISDRGLNLKGTPFRLSDYYTLMDFSFFRCPSNTTVSSVVRPIRCLNSSSRRNNSNSSDDNNNLNYSVVAIMSDLPFSTSWTSSCEFITSAEIPVKDTTWLFDYHSDIPLQWDNPDCRTCETLGGRCGFLGDSEFLVTCHDLPSQGLSRKVKYGLSIGLGLPGLLGIIVLTWMLCTKKNTGGQRRQMGAEFSTIIIPHPSVVVMGLDGAAIERFPKTQLGESGRLPKPNDNICSICLCEYQPKEMLRTIPECNHYFHANCIDGWLKMNATCPLCRNLPERSTSFPSALPLSPTS